jgi:hypothetical protein
MILMLDSLGKEFFGSLLIQRLLVSWSMLSNLLHVMLSNAIFISRVMLARLGKGSLLLGNLNVNKNGLSSVQIKEELTEPFWLFESDHLVLP